MGFKQWLARHTTNPSDFAFRAHASGLVELINHLTASLIAFSGKRAVLNEAQKNRKDSIRKQF